MNGINLQKQLELSELLNRQEWTFDNTKIDEHLAGKRVLVTGAGGSIGSAVARRVAQADVDFLGLVDISENAMFNLLSGWEIPVPCKISVFEACAEQIDCWYPDIIIHAAAYKHVGLMNSCPGSAYQNNVLNTIKFAKAARERGVGQFLFVSTDKAVNPTNYMGASKRLAEAWLFTHAKAYAKVCRFGNVLGSSGSLVEIVSRQLHAGLPVKITAPNMERYFITPDEAVGLLLTSLTFSGCGPFTIDMGVPVKIVDMVKRVSELLGLPLETDLSNPVAGEKLSEELINPGESRSETAHPGIYCLNAQSFGNVTRVIQSVGSRHLDMVDGANRLEVGREDESYIV